MHAAPEKPDPMGVGEEGRDLAMRGIEAAKDLESEIDKENRRGT
jgi:hypothetical protein